MLITISGSQGQGKSTVLESLKIHGFKVLNNKTSRTILSEWGYTLADVYRYPPLTIKFQDEVVKRHFEYSKEAIESDEMFLAERSYADIFTYALCYLGYDNAYSEWLSEYYVKCKQLQSLYDGIIYLSGATHEVKHDGIRSVNSHFASAVDMLIHKFTIEFCSGAESHKLIEVSTPLHDDRINIILNFLNKIEYKQHE